MLSQVGAQPPGSTEFSHKPSHAFCPCQLRPSMSQAVLGAGIPHGAAWSFHCALVNVLSYVFKTLFQLLVLRLRS